jgi:hypothetical protein
MASFDSAHLLYYCDLLARNLDLQVDNKIEGAQGGAETPESIYAEYITMNFKCGKRP